MKLLPGMLVSVRPAECHNCAKFEPTLKTAEYVLLVESSWFGEHLRTYGLKRLA